MASPRSFLVLVSGAAVLVALAACSADVAPPPSAAPDSASSASGSPAPHASAVAYAVPDPVEGEVARSVYQDVEGKSSTSSAMSDAVRTGDQLRVEGQCDGGTWLQYTLRDARVGGTGEVLTSGSLRCDGEVQPSDPYTARFDGPVQLSLTVGEETAGAWIVAHR